MSVSIALDTTPKIMSFYQDFSPTLNGANPFTNTTFTPYFVKCSNGFIDPIVNKFNKNGTSILQSCVPDASCQMANGCSAICGNIPGDSQVVTIKSDLDENQNRRLRITSYNVVNPCVEEDLEVIKSSRTDSFQINSRGKPKFKHDVEKHWHGVALIPLILGVGVILQACVGNNRP